MEIEFTTEKNWVELLPNITISWKPLVLYIGWLRWNISITKQP